MLSRALIICFAFSLLVTTFAIPTERIPTVGTSKDANPSTFSPPTLSIVISTNNLTITATWRPVCIPEHPGRDPTKEASRITHPADCYQAVHNMFVEGSDRELLVWDRQRIWEYGSCGLWLVPMQGLPIHRDTFSRSEIAYSAESVRQECVNAEHGYRGGLVRIAAGVFQVGISGPIEPSLGKWKEGTMLNATALEKRAATP